MVTRILFSVRADAGRVEGTSFAVGELIVAEGVKMFPASMVLKLEKVYQPCVLQTKKRYVGYCYEQSGQAVPEFDAKGMETVRRDTCPLVQKSLERAIRLLFETRNYAHACRQSGCPSRTSSSCREVRLGLDKEGHIPPAVIVDSKVIGRDARAAPRHGERVPFVIVYEQPGAASKNYVIAPEALYASARKTAGSARRG